MRKVTRPKVGQLVRVPTTCFAPQRRGWDGWIFRVGVIEDLYTGKTGRPCAKVRYCNGIAGRYQMLPCKQYSKCLVLDNVFQWDGLAAAQRSYDEYKAYEDAGEQVCWDEDTAFLLANGYIH